MAIANLNQMKIPRHTFVTAFTLALGALVPSAKAEAKPLPAAKIEEATSAIEASEPKTLKQPTLLAYKTALFMASGSVDAATWGKNVKIDAKFRGGEEEFDGAVVTVDFDGYADDSTSGETFVVQLERGKEGAWKVTKVDREAHGRGDQK